MINRVTQVVSTKYVCDILKKEIAAEDAFFIDEDNGFVVSNEAMESLPDFFRTKKGMLRLLRSSHQLDMMKSRVWVLSANTGSTFDYKGGDRDDKYQNGKDVLLDLETMQCHGQEKTFHVFVDGQHSFTVQVTPKTFNEVKITEVPC